MQLPRVSYMLLQSKAKKQLFFQTDNDTVVKICHKLKRSEEIRDDAFQNAPAPQLIASSTTGKSIMPNGVSGINTSSFVISSFVYQEYLRDGQESKRNYCFYKSNNKPEN